jgi:head-tail adaptor
MRAGTLDRRITIQRKSDTPSTDGHPVETWSNLVARRWASVMPTGGDERFTDPQYAAKEQTTFHIRWSQDVADLSPLDRIVYPATDGTPAPNTVYDILAVHELGRRETLQIVTFRRADI